MYKITDALLQNDYTYISVTNNVCKYVKGNVEFIREKIPYRHMYIYKFTLKRLNMEDVEYTKKQQVKGLLEIIPTLT